MMRVTLAIAILELAMAAGSLWSADAAPPAALPVDLSLQGRVVGPDGDRVTPGQLTKLKAALTVTRDGTSTVLLESPADACPTAYQWELSNPPKTYDISQWIDSDGRGLTFATSEPGEYHFVLAISKWTGGPTPLLRLARYTLTVAATPVATPLAGPTPRTVPNPLSPQQPAPPLSPNEPPSNPKTAPTPTPDDSDLAGKFGLSTKVRDKISELVPASTRDKAKELANVYRDVAALVIDEKIGAMTAGPKIKSMNSAVLTEESDRAAWNPLLEWLGAEFTALAASGKLTSKKDVVVALTEVSLGFTLAAIAESN